MRRITNGFITGLLTALLALTILLSGCGADKPQENLSSASDRRESSAEEDNTKDEDWQVTDDLGRTVVGTARPGRAAALTASFAQTWLLAGGEIAAAPKDAWEDLNLDLDETTLDLGNYNEINQEMLFLSEPDFVIASAKTNNHLELLNTLEKTGIPVLYFEVNAFEDYLRVLKICTEITGREDLYEQNGTSVKVQVDNTIASAKEAVSKQEPPKVLLLRTVGSAVKAKDSEGAVAGLILRDLGCVNIADGSDLLEELSLEKIITEDPDYIFILQQGNDSEEAIRAVGENLSDNPAWNELKAVKEDCVFWLDKYLYQFKPNNRWGEAYEGLEEILYGTP